MKERTYTLKIRAVWIIQLLCPDGKWRNADYTMKQGHAYGSIEEVSRRNERSKRETPPMRVVPAIPQILPSAN